MLVKCLKQCWVCCKPRKCINNIISSSSTPVVHFFTQHPEWSLKTENPFISSDCLKYSGTVPCLKSQIPTSPWPCMVACTSFCTPIPLSPPLLCAADMLLPFLFLKHTKPLPASRPFPGLCFPHILRNLLTHTSTQSQLRNTGYRLWPSHHLCLAAATGLFNE